MVTITEDFVSFETAKLLKEKGFDNVSSIMYKENGEMCINPKSASSWRLKYWYPCLTLQMAMKWLRIKHHIDIEVNVYSKDHIGLLNYFFEIRKNGSLLILDDVNHVRDSYEEATEEAIKYCLKNLI